MGLHTQNAVAIFLIAALTVVNILGVRTGALVQNVFTLAKILALIGLIVIGFTVGKDALAIHANFGDFWRNASWGNLYPVKVGSDGRTEFIGLFAILAVVQVGSLFSADAWNNVTFTAAEVKNPQRNLPVALALGAGGVILLYILANLAYLATLPLDQIKIAPEDRVGTAVLEHAFSGSGARWMAVAIMVSTFGCVNGMVMAGARVYYAMSQDGLFFKKVSEIHPRFKTPAISLLLQGVWASVLCISGSYGQLLDYIIFAALLFYILTIAGVFILRRTRPDVHRPYRAFGYPVLPAIYIGMAIFIDIILLRFKPQYTWPGLLIVCSGIPVYFILNRLLTKKSRRVVMKELA
jgi:APA family basic amino acid/polyamine antiporter